MSSADPLTMNRRRVRRRRHGYRGYGSPLREEHSGFVHWGRGFAGVEFPGDTVGIGRRRGFLPELLRVERER